MQFLLEYSESNSRFLFNPLDTVNARWSVGIMDYGRRPITIISDSSFEPEFLEFILDRSDKGYSYERVASEVLNYIATNIDGYTK